MPNKLSIIRVQSHNNYCQKIRLFVLKFKQESRIKKASSKNKMRIVTLKSIKQEKDENFDPKKLEIENFKQVLLCSEI